jgi:serine/threonine-protein kinase
MAPEQLAGEKASRQSDIYALGLVLYQLFTGKDAFPGETLEKIVRQRQKGAPERISSIVKGVDPAVERIILNCPQREPDLRPRTVLNVSAALPGSDPLAAANRRGRDALPRDGGCRRRSAPDPRRLAVGHCVAIVVGWVAIGFLLHQGTVLAFTPLDKSHEVMAERARQIVSKLGYASPPVDSAYWYEANRDFLRYHAQKGPGQQPVEQFWADLPGVWQFTYRQSPQPLVTGSETAPVSVSDPPRDMPGMIAVQLDARGRLLYFEAVPPRIEDASSTSEPDWTVALTEAGIDAKSLTEASPRFLPVVGFDRRAYGEHWKVGTIAAALGVHHETVRAALVNDTQGLRRGTCRTTQLDPYLPFIRDTGRSDSGRRARGAEDEANRGAGAFEHGTAQIVVDQGARDAGQVSRASTWPRRKLSSV